MGVTGELGLLWSRHLESLNPVSGKPLLSCPILSKAYICIIFVPYKTFHRNLKSFFSVDGWKFKIKVQESQ